MISVNRVIRPSLQRSYVARQGGSGLFHGFALTQGATGKHKNDVESTWLIAKGATASGKDLSQLWDTYLTSKGFTTGKLKDRMKAFFTTGVQA